MATVSILIPAFKPAHLAKALRSACAQTFNDIEILVGDDTPGADLESIVEAIGDPRIRYFHHGFQNGPQNTRALWHRARGRYVKWLFDDDVLLPSSVESLVGALRAHPGSALAFHGRVFIDENDRLLHVPPAIVEEGQHLALERQVLVQHMIGKLDNFVGEPSNTLLDREALSEQALTDYREWELDYLCDVAMFLNAAEHGPVIAVGGYLSCFRRHSAQMSNPASPNFSAGLYEWELLVRGEAAAGQLTGSQLAFAQTSLSLLYTRWSDALPELRRFLSGMAQFAALPAHELLRDASYQANLNAAREMVRARMGSRARKPRLPAHCPLCEQPVSRWLRYRGDDSGGDFTHSLDISGPTRTTLLCPHCYASANDRLVWLYLAKSGLLDDIARKKVLHLAPEVRLEPRLRALRPLEYAVADPFPRIPAHRPVDAGSLPYPDDHFDFILCNNVLSQVKDVQRTLAELRRCLSPDGTLVAQTSYSPALERSLEPNGSAVHIFAERLFAQTRHLRLFGADIAGHFASAGLYGSLSCFDRPSDEQELWRAGCDSSTPFFVFTKRQAIKDEPVFPI